MISEKSEGKITIGIVAPYLSFKELVTKISGEIENVNFEIFEGIVELFLLILREKSRFLIKQQGE